MSSANAQNTTVRVVLAAGDAAASPAERFNIDREAAAKRALKLKAMQQRLQRLNDYCDKAAAEIRASLERSPR